MESVTTIAQPDESQQVDDIQEIVPSGSRRDCLVYPNSKVVATNNSTNATCETGRGRNVSADIWQSENLAVTSSTNRVNAKADGKNNSLDQNQNLSVEPSSMHMPSQVPPTEGGHPTIGKDQFYNQVPATQQSEEGRSYMESYQQSIGIKTEKLPSPSQPVVHEAHPAPKIRTDENYTSLQQSDNIPGQKDDNQGKKVFILHSVPKNDLRGNDSLVLFATALRHHGINVSIDLFEQDVTNDNWSIWCEREILKANVVLCIITPNFYKSITEQDRIKGYAVYNVMSDSTKDIAFRAVFLDTEKDMNNVPLSMRGATCYCISSQNLNIHDEEFTNLYAFLAGQNRIEKPKLGKIIQLVPKKSKCKLKFITIITVVLLW